MKAREKDEEDGTVNNRREPSLGLSLIPIATVLCLLILSLTRCKMDMQIPLIAASIVAAIIGHFALNYKWADMEQGIVDAIMNAMQAIIICCIIGLIIGSWIMGGIVPSMIFYGLKIISPKFFLVTCLLLCSIVSVSTGSSWTTCATIGIAMIGIGEGLGIPAPVTAGCVISGAYFGDKMSPFSDTTNLAPAMAGTTIFAHIRHMTYTTGVSYVISLIMFFIINLRYTGSQDKNLEIVKSMNRALSEGFYLSPLLLLPPLIIIVMIIFKIPAIPGLMFSVFLGIGCAAIFQHERFIDIADVLQYGYAMKSGNEMVDNLLSLGGMQSMMWTVSLILCSLTFGGLMYSTGMINKIAKSILNIAKGVGGLITATIVTAIVINLTCGEQYLSILITGKLYREEYEKRDLAPQNLSRALEDSGTLTSVLIPWTTCAVAISSYLGVPTLAYLPFCFLNIVNPFISLIYGWTGFTIKKISDIPEEDIIRSLDYTQNKGGKHE